MPYPERYLGKRHPPTFRKRQHTQLPSSQYTDVPGILVEYIDGFEFYAIGENSQHGFGGPCAKMLFGLSNSLVIEEC